MKLLGLTTMLASAWLLAGCGQLLTAGTADLAGIAGAGIAGSVTKDATVGAAIGLGVASVANFGLEYAERRVHGVEQDRIAEVAGTLPEGGAGVWSVSHDVAIEPNEHGELVVTRVFAARFDPSGTNPGATGFTCKEIVFSVDTGTVEKPKRGFYTATVCQDGTRWKWASAEPATARWGSLQ